MGLKPGDDDRIGAGPGDERAAYRRTAATGCFEGADRTAGDMIAFWADLLERYPIVSIEDGLARGRLGRLGQLTQSWATACSWSATTCS